MADSNGGSPLDELRSIIVGPEQNRLEDLEQRLEEAAPPRAEEVSDVLPAAITIGATRDDRLRGALTPLVEETIFTSVRRDPQPLADAIFPVIGPAIRKAIAAAIGGLVQTLNQGLEHTFSIQGLRWRLEAMRSGVSFGEVVLRHSLVYRVEQVFLVHREGGLLLLHVKDDAVRDQGAEMVAGMLSAIQDFARDSFQVGSRDTLETMQVGELNVLVEDGPHALIAAVVRGHPPQSLKTELQQALELIHATYAEQLVLFQGDASVFARAKPILERCLAQEVVAPPRKGRWRFWMMAAIVVAGLAVYLVPRTIANRRWGHFVELLRGEPGVVVTETGRRDGRFYVAGLLDPAARNPDSLLALASLRGASVVQQWEPYHSLDSTFALRRVRTALAREIAAVNGQAFYYPAGQDQPNSEALAALSEMVRLLRTVGAVSRRNGVTPTLTILGQTDDTGEEVVNVRLGRARAERVRDLIAASGADVRLEAAGAEPSRVAGAPAPAARPERRRVSFSLQFSTD